MTATTINRNPAAAAEMNTIRLCSVTDKMRLLYE